MAFATLLLAEHRPRWPSGRDSSRSSPAVEPELVYVVTLPLAVPICVQPLVPFGERSIWKPVSLLALSVQFRRISVDERSSRSNRRAPSAA